MAMGRVLIATMMITMGLGAARSVQAADKIRLGIIPISESLGAVIAEKKGYFKEADIEVEMTSFNSGALALPLLQAGRLDIAFSNTVSTLQALERGFDAIMLAPGAVARSTAPDTTSAMLALEGTIKSAKDYEGKRIAVNVINSSAWLYDLVYLDKIGVDRSKVRFVEVPFPQMNDPLLNKQVDVITQVEPFRTGLRDTGKIDVLAFPYVETQPGADITQYIALNDWVTKHRDLAIRFARAILKGAILANAESSTADVRQINMEFTHLNPVLKDRVELPLFGSGVNVAEITKTMELMLKYGLMKKPVNLSSRVMAVQ